MSIEEYETMMPEESMGEVEQAESRARHKMSWARRGLYNAMSNVALDVRYSQQINVESANRDIDSAIEHIIEAAVSMAYARFLEAGLIKSERD